MIRLDKKARSNSMHNSLPKMNLKYKDRIKAKEWKFIIIQTPSIRNMGNSTNIRFKVLLETKRDIS